MPDSKFSNICICCHAEFPDDTYLNTKGVCGSVVCQNHFIRLVEISEKARTREIKGANARNPGKHKELH